MKQQIQQTPLKSIKSPQLVLARSNSTSTVTLDGMRHVEIIPATLSLPTNYNIQLRSVLKTSGLFNKDSEPSDKLDELFANDNEFTLHRLLSDIGTADLNFDMNEITKFDPVRLLDTRSLSEFFQSDPIEQVRTANDSQPNQFDSVLPSAIAGPSGSYMEYCPLTPEQPVKPVFHIDASQLKMEPDNSIVYTQLNTLENFLLTPATQTPTEQEFNFDPNTLAAFEHDYGFLSKRPTAADTPSPSPTISKRTSTARKSCRTSSRLQSRAMLIDFNQIVNGDSCPSPAESEESSLSSKKSKLNRHVHRAIDIKTEDDLSYYLERRRRNNEASKQSRAARKQKFGDMDRRCAEYECANNELRSKISTLEAVTTDLKSRLIHNFQRKGGV